MGWGSWRSRGARSCVLVSYPANGHAAGTRPGPGVALVDDVQVVASQKLPEGAAKVDLLTSSAWDQPRPSASGPASCPATDLLAVHDLLLEDAQPKQME